MESFAFLFNRLETISSIPDHYGHSGDTLKYKPLAGAVQNRLNGPNRPTGQRPQLIYTAALHKALCASGSSVIRPGRQ